MLDIMLVLLATGRGALLSHNTSTRTAGIKGKSDHATPMLLLLPITDRSRPLLLHLLLGAAATFATGLTSAAFFPCAAQQSAAVPPVVAQTGDLPAATAVGRLLRQLGPTKRSEALIARRDIYWPTAVIACAIAAARGYRPRWRKR